MQAAGYPTATTSICMISAIETTITYDSPTDELDHDPIETTTIIIPPQLAP
jgi:hypothetical protein